jgi:hypothetical protein
MRQWQTQAPAKAFVCANHKFLISATCKKGELAGSGEHAREGMSGVSGKFYG